MVDYTSLNFKINAKMKKLIGQNELISPWRMFEVDFNLIISIMANKLVDLRLKCNFGVWNGFGSVCLVFQTDRMRGKDVGLSYIGYDRPLLK
jgi:hypothetical protein